MEPLDRAKQLARERYGRFTPLRLGLVAHDAGLLGNPYDHGRAREHFLDGLVWSWIYRCRREERELTPHSQKGITRA